MKLNVLILTGACSTLTACFTPTAVPAPDNTVKDTMAPMLTELALIGDVQTDRPVLNFSSSEIGNIQWQGACGSTISRAQENDNAIELTPLVDGSYSDCSITVTDDAGNISAPLPISVFSIDAGLMKLDNSGIPLSNQNTPWDEMSAEGSASHWSCIKDNKTGLSWEIKSNDAADLQYKEWNYTWYMTDPAINGGDHGVGDLGLGLVTGYELEVNNNARPNLVGSDDCLDANRCDTQKYIADINAETLCGANDWRLPTMPELDSISLCVTSNSGNCGATPNIDTNYFPNIPNGYYWSTWLLQTSDIWRKSYAQSSLGNNWKHMPNHVLLVR